MRRLHTLLLAALLLAPLAASNAARAGELPPPAVLLALLRGTMSALNQANVTGNYSVLRDLAAPTFRDANSSAALADRFRVWRERRLDFAAVLLLDAELSGPPSIGADGALRIAGRFPTAPLGVGFDMTFRPVDGNWRLAAIRAEIVEPRAVSAAAPTAEPEPEITGSVSPVRRVAGAPPAQAMPAPIPVRLPTPPGDRPRS